MSKITKRSLMLHSLKFCGVGVLSAFIPRFSKLALASTPEIIISNRNKITPEITSLNHPTFFSNTNNLRRKSGSPFLAKGHFLSVEGYVTDLVDVPIENVRIKMWQANHFGYYQHSVDPEDIDRFDQDFLGCGKTTTDNLGYYSFLTIDPGFYGNRTPHLHFTVEYDYYNDKKPLETQMFFPGHPLNEKDPRYRELNAMQKNLVTCAIEPIDQENPIAGKRALFNIKLDIIHPVKRY